MLPQPIDSNSCRPRNQRRAFGFRISSASFTSSVMKSRRTEPSRRRWSHFEHRAVSARNSPFMRKMTFLPSLAAMATFGGHRLQRIDLHSRNPASKGQQPTPAGELTGEGARPVLDRPQGESYFAGLAVSASTKARNGPEVLPLCQATKTSQVAPVSATGIITTFGIFR